MNASSRCWKSRGRSENAKSTARDSIPPSPFLRGRACAAPPAGTCSGRPPGTCAGRGRRTCAPAVLDHPYADPDDEEDEPLDLMTLPDGEITYQRPPELFRAWPCATPGAVSVT